MIIIIIIITAPVILGVLGLVKKGTENYIGKIPDNISITARATEDCPLWNSPNTYEDSMYQVIQHTYNCPKLMDWTCYHHHHHHHHHHTVHVFGHIWFEPSSGYIFNPRVAAQANMSLRWAQGIFIPLNIHCIVYYCYIFLFSHVLIAWSACVIHP